MFIYNNKNKAKAPKSIKADVWKFKQVNERSTKKHWEGTSERNKPCDLNSYIHTAFTMVDVKSTFIVLVILIRTCVLWQKLWIDNL